MIWRTSVRVCVWDRETGRAVRYAFFALRCTPPGGVRSARGYGSARRWEEWISDVGFGEARFWGGGAERLRHRSEADVEPQPSLHSQVGPCETAHCEKQINLISLLLFSHIPSVTLSNISPHCFYFSYAFSFSPHDSLFCLPVFKLVYRFPFLCFFLSLYESILSNRFTSFSVTLDSGVWLFAS